MKHSMTQPLVPPQFGWGGRFQPSEGYAFPYRYGAGRMPPPETVCQASGAWLCPPSLRGAEATT